MYRNNNNLELRTYCKGIIGKGSNTTDSAWHLIYNIFREEINEWKTKFAMFTKCGPVLEVEEVSTEDHISQSFSWKCNEHCHTRRWLRLKPTVMVVFGRNGGIPKTQLVLASTNNNHPSCIGTLMCEKICAAKPAPTHPHSNWSLEYIG